jgi:hypothetical protein
MSGDRTLYDSPSMAPLLADETDLDSSILTSRPVVEVFRTSAAIWQNRSNQSNATQSTSDAAHQVGSVKNGFFKVSSGEDSISQVGTIEFRLAQVGITQIDTNHLSTPEQGSSRGLSHIGSTEVGSNQGSIFQISSFQVNSSQITSIDISVEQPSSAQVSPFQVGSSKISSPQTNFFQINPLKISSPQISHIKFSLPSSITLQQLLSSHNSNLPNTTVPAWTEFFQGQTSFNLNIEIQDLPTGQIAESQLTSYDSSDRPTSGILTLDIDANGLDGYIDFNTEDNTEYVIALTSTAFKATPGSPTYGLGE